MKTLLARILCSAARSMWKKDPTLGNYTSETYQHELNLAFHFAAELRQCLPWMHCDFDVAKRGGNRERPDIIFHRRGSHALNFLVIEVKRERSRSAVPADLSQIRDRWFGGRLAYRFGAAMILADDKPEFEAQVLSRTGVDDAPIIVNHSTMGPPLAQASFARIRRKTLCRAVDRILAAKQRDAEVDVSALEREIDELVYALYGLTKEERALVGDPARAK